MYDVTAVEIPQDEPCREPEHQDDTDLPQHVRLLEFGYYSYADCQPLSWIDFRLDLTADVLDSNLIFEVEDLGSDYNPQAISINLYESEIVPIDRHTEYRVTTSVGKLWTISLSQPTVQRDFAEGLITLGVQCGVSPVSFRAIVHTGKPRHRLARLMWHAPRCEPCAHSRAWLHTSVHAQQARGFDVDLQPTRGLSTESAMCACVVCALRSRSGARPGRMAGGCNLQGRLGVSLLRYLREQSAMG